MYRRACLLTLLLQSLICPVHAHDPSAWGGLYRSRDDGASWLPVDAGLFVSGAVSVAISPTDPNHLLYSTDSRLLRSGNGGRDWKPEGEGVVGAPALVAAFDRDGTGAIASSAGGIYWTADGKRWQDSNAPTGAAPARAIAAGATPGRFYLAGSRSLFVSDDSGHRWTRAGDALPEGAITTLLVLAAPQERVFAIAAGEPWVTRDGAGTWRPAGVGLPRGRVETLAADAPPGTRLWAAGGAQVYSSDDDGATWRAVGRPLPEPDTSVRGIAAASDGQVIVLTTHRGMVRSRDGGKTWGAVEGALPTHLEAGPLIRDPHDRATLYAGFALTPYSEIWRRADEGYSLLSQIDPVSLAGGAAFLLLLVILGVLAARRLSAAYAGHDARAPVHRHPKETAR